MLLWGDTSPDRPQQPRMLTQWTKMFTGLPRAQSCQGTVRLRVTLCHSRNTEDRISVICRNTKMCCMLIRLYLILHDKNPLPGSYLAHQLSARSKPTGPSFKTLKIQGYCTNTRDKCSSADKCRSMAGTARAGKGETIPRKTVMEKNNVKSCLLNDC